MAELVVDWTELVVRLSWWERIVALHGNVRVPLASVESAWVVARSGDELGPRRSFSPSYPGTIGFLDTGLGVRTYGGDAAGRAYNGFVAVRRRRPAVKVRLCQPHSPLRGFHALLVTVADPKATAAHIMDARAKGKLLGQVQARRLWLPWRPRMRLISAWPRGLEYLGAIGTWYGAWVRRRFTGWLRPVMVIFLLPLLVAGMLGWVLVAEITILAFGASIYLVVGEWLLLAPMFPIVLAARLASVRPWPLVAVAGPQRWRARVAGWNASGQAAAAAAGALTSGAEPAAPPWSPGARAAQIWR